MLVLWGRVVEILGSDDEGSQEDTVSSAMHALCNTRQTMLESLEVD